MTKSFAQCPQKASKSGNDRSTVFLTLNSTGIAGGESYTGRLREIVRFCAITRLLLPSAMYAATGIVRRCDLCDCRARQPSEFPSFLCCFRILWRRRRPGFERSHRVPASPSAVGYLVSCAVDRSGADKDAPRLGPIWRGNTTAFLGERTPAFCARRRGRRRR